MSLSLHDMTFGPSSVSSPDINIRVKGGHLDLSLFDSVRPRKGAFMSNPPSMSKANDVRDYGVVVFF